MLYGNRGKMGIHDKRSSSLARGEEILENFPMPLARAQQNALWPVKPLRHDLHGLGSWQTRMGRDAKECENRGP